MSTAMTPLELKVVELERALRDVHNALHLGDHAGAHELCHRACGINGTELQADRPSFYSDFDRAFLTAVRKHNVPAAYVIFEQGKTNPRAVRVLTGGNVFALEILKPALSAGMNAIGTLHTPERREG